MATATPATIPLLHRFLAIGLVMLAAVLVGLRHLTLTPMLPDDNVPQLVAYAMSGLSLALAAVAYFILKPGVPERPPGQSVADFWSTPEVATKAMSVWFCLEGAGTISAAGYYLTGEPVCALAAVLGIVAFWSCGPNVFAKA